MPWKDIETFISKKFEEYKSELKDATSRQEHQKKFNEWYTSDEKKRELALDALLEQQKSGSTSASTTGSTGIYSGTIQEKFWQFFVAAGYTKQAVAGMMGNVQHESNFDSSLIEQTPGPSNGEGFGLIQWSYGRKTRLIELAAEQGREVTDVQFQFEFLNIELNESGNWLSVWADYPFDTFKSTTDITYATEAFCWMFERPAVASANISGRIEYSKKYYDEFANKDFSNMTVTGNAAVQAVIAEAKKYLGLAYSQANRYGPSSYDCSSYMQAVFRTVIGRDIGINTWAQEINAGTLIPVNQRRAGDLLLFGVPGDPYHVALSLGGDDIYHAANPDKGILQDKIWPGTEFFPYIAIRIPELE